LQKWDAAAFLMWIRAVKATNPEKKSGGIGKGTPGPGRGKGNANALTKDVKAMILGALSAAGGQAYLQRQADENPSAFMTLVGKCMPKEITGADGKPLIPTKLKIELIG